MTNNNTLHPENIRPYITSDCMNCNGLCCKTLYCFKQDGFPEDKPANVPCRYLTSSNRCKIHDTLSQRKLLGCMRYDCGGAGNHLTQLAKDSPITSHTYTKMLQMHQILQYLWEVYRYETEEKVRKHIVELWNTWQQATARMDTFLDFDIDAYRQEVNLTLRSMIKHIISSYPKENQITYKDVIGKDLTKQSLQGMDLSMRYMMAANLSNTNLCDTILLGSDVRDVNISGSDLTKVRFLTQLQLNSMCGNHETLLPKHLNLPTHWPKESL